MNIKVTQEHIDRGIPKSCESCPVALAIREAFPKTILTVNRYTIGIYEIGETVYHVCTPEVAAEFISDFDSYRDVDPFEFELNVEDSFKV